MLTVKRNHYANEFNRAFCLAEIFILDIPVRGLLFLGKITFFESHYLYNENIRVVCIPSVTTTIFVAPVLCLSNSRHTQRFV